MSSNTPVRVFIGSGEVSRLERKVMMYSLRKNSRREVDIWVFNGTHNSIERNADKPYLAPLSLELKYHNFTEFSLYRYLIPQLCNFEGRAIYVDSDMVCLDDIGQLFDLPMNGCDFLASKHYGEEEWGTSVMLIDCAKCRFDLDEIFREIGEGKYTLLDFSRMNPKYRQYHPLQIGELDPNWNVFDRHDEQTKLIHYTELLTQPWRVSGHPYGQLWFDYLQQALAAGVATEHDIFLGIQRGAARANIREGNSPLPPAAAQAAPPADAAVPRRGNPLRRAARKLLNMVSASRTA